MRDIVLEPISVTFAAPVDHLEVRVSSPLTPSSGGVSEVAPARRVIAETRSDHAPLRLIATYDGDDERVSVRVTPALAMMRTYDGEPAAPPEVEVECIATAEGDRGVVLLPLRVIAGTSW